MKYKLLVLALNLIPAFVLAQNNHTMLGTWIGANNAAVMGSGLFHPNQENNENNVRFRNVELILVIDKEQGRNFSGTIGATNNKNPTNVNHKESILGAYSKDMNSGAMVSENGHFAFKLIQPNILETCYTQVPTNNPSVPRLAACFEMTKQ